ncbi:universal stress protein [Herbiconiux sp. KACC 21604]|uniref:universal stress protein n=1 Tax=unclassified Herbiconiux TaxID=2618217 RepID=UPI00149094AC|nr:universal stress protein [Herbiconiux sp. SALV-R1]QJU54814.1 universal stress protein [Herbiconiux sp. SALV-R1]WPO85930.1 universal stress protein [Herbiconiux sp. KACC 21604]
MRFIVGYTDTPAGRDALALGVRLARATGARLDLVLVLSSEERATIVPADPGYERYVRETAEGWLAEALGTVPDDVRAGSHVVYAESFADGVLDAARVLDARLIVVGAARGGILGRFTLGSAANALLHAATVPVALAPDGCRDTAGDAPISRITCAVGTRPGAEALLGSAIGAARAAHLPLRLISLVALDQPVDSQHRDAIVRAAAHATAVLERAAAGLPDDVEVTSEVVTGRRVEDAVSGLDWEPTEIALVGSSRLAQPRQLFLGSTAAKMLRELPVPLVVVPRDAAVTIGDAS